MKIDLGGSTTKVAFYPREEIIESFQETLLVCDENTKELLPSLPKFRIILPAGEEYKNWKSLEKIFDGAVHHRLGRDSLFLGLGGGVVCDMTALAASLYMRGSRLVLVPTTLLAMVDAALGGKTGVDYQGFKNLLGTFYPAEEVRLCPELLASLPNRDFLGGLAEVIKHALLGDSDLLELLWKRKDGILSREEELLGEMITLACKVKIKYVESDFRESDSRMHLNFGHTFAHALETVSGFRIHHGYAVAWGIKKALELGHLLGITKQDYVREGTDLLKAYGFPLSYPDYPATAILQAMGRDKKRRGGRIQVVLQEGFGHTIIITPPEEKILEVLNLQ